MRQSQCHCNNLGERSVAILKYFQLSDTTERDKGQRPAAAPAPPAADHQAAAPTAAATRRTSSVATTASDHSGCQEAVLPEPASAPAATLLASESVCPGMPTDDYNHFMLISKTLKSCMIYEKTFKINRYLHLLEWNLPCWSSSCLNRGANPKAPSNKILVDIKLSSRIKNCH